MKNKKKQKVELPIEEDIFLNYVYANEMKYKSYTDNIRNGYSYNSWRMLNESSLTLLHVFNRKRQGECSRTLVKDSKDSNIFRIVDSDEDP